MNELLGFIVLTSPLIFIVLWIIIGLPLAILGAKRYSDDEASKKKKLLKGLVVATIVFLLPFIDSIIGRTYLSYLCNFEAGPNVYHTVVLPDKYWGKDGKLNLLSENMDFDSNKIGNRFTFKFHNIGNIKILGIEKFSWQVTDQNYKLILGEIVSYRYWGGWISKNLSVSNRAISCKGLYGRKPLRDFYYAIFLPSNAAK